ncbi:ABC transporter ATP-binding protein [Actinotalea sp. BY-33]|uniref:ABC transporter ATP-binding protein n=1 Tax=Actinotalea soli TaxID=2819234 RepID=A0A939LQ73_9CELL|nr:ABC transporter ATP-binding protein [Actinotalea soli]MBO1751758.1 ABC transporter ATP-binding protein [Actinotalea soli]
MTNAIDMQAVTRRFGESTALDAVDVTVPEGSICGLLGRNGAGKTTMMSIIAGQDRPSSGRVEVLGQEPFENESVLAMLSFVRDNQRYPDDYRLHHVLRIAPDFAPHWSEEVAAELVDGFRIPARTPIKKFSRGQLSSVAIVLGLASRAPVTLLDEPYLGLDVTARALFHDMLLRDYAAHPRTIVLSTHLVQESEALFDRVVILDGGTVRVSSEAEDVRDLAFTLSGATDVVQGLTARSTVLSTHTVAGLMSATVWGALDDESRTTARDLGARVAPASLHELVAAIGEHRPEPADLALHEKKGVRA